MLLGVPNFSEGRDESLIERIAAQFSAGAELLDRHSDPLHNRTVLTLAQRPRALGEALVRGAGACFTALNLNSHAGAHPRTGVLDVCPVVWLDEGDREAAIADAKGVGRSIGDAGVPVFLYGDLASSEERRERAYFREGGIRRLTERMAAGELTPDAGPAAPHPRAGAALVTARPPLAAFNVELVGLSIDAARKAAAKVREAGGGLPGVRAIAIDRGGDRAQISTNVHDPISVPLAEVVAAIRGAAGDARLVSAEIVGLVPRAAMEGFQDEVPLPAFDPAQHVIEERL